MTRTELSESGDDREASISRSLSLSVWVSLPSMS